MFKIRLNELRNLNIKGVSKTFMTSSNKKEKVKIL